MIHGKIAEDRAHPAPSRWLETQRCSGLLLVQTFQKDPLTSGGAPREEPCGRTGCGGEHRNHDLVRFASLRRCDNSDSERAIVEASDLRAGSTGHDPHEHLRSFGMWPEGSHGQEGTVLSPQSERDPTDRKTVERGGSQRVLRLRSEVRDARYEGRRSAFLSGPMTNASSICPMSVYDAEST